MKPLGPATVATTAVLVAQTLAVPVAQQGLEKRAPAADPVLQTLNSGS